MTAQVQSMLEQAKQLTPEERAELANALWDSLDNAERLPPDQVERLWAEEIRRRDDRLQAGEAVSHDADQVLDEIEGELRSMRPTSR